MSAPRNVTRIRGLLQESVEEAVAAMTWLESSDQAMVALAIKYAAEIDKAGDDQRAVGYLGQNLMGALRSLGGTPSERAALRADKPVGSRLAQLRDAASAVGEHHS
jgi:hypothetical protein